MLLWWGCHEGLATPIGNQKTRLSLIFSNGFVCISKSPFCTCYALGIINKHLQVIHFTLSHLEAKFVCLNDPKRYLSQLLPGRTNLAGLVQG